MSVQLVADVSGSGSNSYQTADAVQAILDGVVNADAWNVIAEADADALDVICVQSTALIDVIAYQGQKTLVAQALSWPRLWVPDPDFGDVEGDVGGWQATASAPNIYLDSTTIPRRILRGHALLCLEIARAGADDVWGVDDSLNVAKKSLDIITTEFVDVAKRRTGLRRYPMVWAPIFPLTRAAKPQSVERA